MEWLCTKDVYKFAYIFREIAQLIDVVKISTKSMPKSISSLSTWDSISQIAKGVDMYVCVFLQSKFLQKYFALTPSLDKIQKLIFVYRM